MLELSKNVRELKSILYGNSESEPVAEACAQLTQEFFRENTLRLLINCLPKLNLEVSGTGLIGLFSFQITIELFCLFYFCGFLLIHFWDSTLMYLEVSRMGDGKKISYLDFHIKVFVRSFCLYVLKFVVSCCYHF